MHNAEEMVADAFIWTQTKKNWVKKCDLSNK